MTNNLNPRHTCRESGLATIPPGMALFIYSWRYGDEWEWAECIAASATEAFAFIAPPHGAHAVLDKAVYNDDNMPMEVW